MNAPEAPGEETTAVDAQHPWLGLASFTEETRPYFHGREEEVGELSRRVQRKLLTVLFGQSGLGKTSILRAGIVPRLRPDGYCPVYVRIDYSAHTPPPAEQIKQAIFRATSASGSWTQAGVAEEGESLWEFLHHRDDILKDANGKTVIPLLIFDQFEEIFTLAQADDAGRKRAAQFIEDLADLVENRPPKALEARLEEDDSLSDRFDFGRADYRILIALREDYLAHLESVKAAMPSITQNRMRLAPMTGQQALQAVMKPGGRLVSREVAESIVRFIAGGSELQNAEVEPSLLSLICRELNNTRLAQGKPEISADLLAGSHDTILKEFYERALADQPPGVRKVIEDNLLTDSGYRENLAEENIVNDFAEVGAKPDALALLVNRRLLRIEERLDIRRVELTHDVLCGVVKASRTERLAREAKATAERQLVEQKERVARTRAALVKARQIAIGAGVLAVVAVASAIWGFISTSRAKEAEAQAQETRKLAENGRAEAEKLVVYLLEDFQVELEPVGRLDIVVNLSKRAMNYYAGLPAALRTPATERNRALAEVRYATALRNLGQLDEAYKSATDAVAVLSKLKDAGDTSEATLISLALGHSAISRVQNQQGKFSEARKQGTTAYAMLLPLAEAANAGIPLRRALVQIGVAQGFNVMRDGDHEEAIGIFEKSRAVARSIDGLQLGDTIAASLFVEAAAWQMQSLQALDRVDDARRIGEEARPIADGVLGKQPGHMLALRARGLLLSRLADIDGTRLKFKLALPVLHAAARDYEAYLKVDPGNTIAWNNLGAQYQSIALYTDASGRAREALKYMRMAANTGAQGTQTAVRAGNVANVWWHVARMEAEIGNRDASQAAIQEGARNMARFYEGAAPGEFRRAIREPWLPLQQSALHALYGEFAKAREFASMALAALEKAKPESEGQKRFHAINLADAYEGIGFSSYQLGDYAAAEAALRRATELRTSFDERSVWDRLFLANVRAQHTAALARLGRIVDARAALDPALKYHATLPDSSEAPLLRVYLAQAKLSQGLANPPEARAHLSAALVLLDGLPPESRTHASIRQLHAEIARELAARR
ncbi:MAG: hypothetical protein IPL06_04055 [Betaproteobacteria bacterium]|nr:hypothetical protein [Betaproteobacteria bacterium]